MTDCPNALMRDTLPDLLHDRIAPAEREAVMAHVAECADCTAELALLRSVHMSLSPAPAVDVAAIVRALPGAPLRRLTLQPSMRRSAWRRASRWQAAAALVLIVGGGWLAATQSGWSGATAIAVADSAPGAPPVRPTNSPASEPRSTTVLASGDVADARERPAPVSSLGVSVADLSEAELDAVMQAMAGAVALPPVEPLPAIAPIIMDILEGEA